MFARARRIQTLVFGISAVMLAPVFMRDSRAAEPDSTVQVSWAGLKTSPSSAAVDDGAVLKRMQSAASALIQILGHTPRAPVRVKLLDYPTFRSQSGVPSWATGLFTRGEILLPTHDHGVDHDGEFWRTFRHEYVHAIVSSASSGKCPAWLDEGLAQILEGPRSELIEASLDLLTEAPDALPLSQLNHDLTRFNGRDAQIAYAQSYLASLVLLRRQGQGGLQSFFRVLSSGRSPEDALREVFSLAPGDLERVMRRELDVRKELRERPRDAERIYLVRAEPDPKLEEAARGGIETENGEWSYPAGVSRASPRTDVSTVSE